MCVRLKFECAFSPSSFSALKRSPLAQNTFVPGAKSVRLQDNQRIHFLFGRWLENPEKEQKLGKIFCKSPFRLGMELKKGQEQGRDERTQDDYPT